MTQAAVRKAIIALIEKNYPKITITQGTDFVSLYETPGDHETAVSMSFSQTGPLIRRMQKASRRRQPAHKTVARTKRRPK